MNKVKRNHRVTVLILIICLLQNVLPVYAAETAVAEKLRLQQTQGTVEVANQNGKVLPIVQEMRLFDGNNIKTEAKSYAWIGLDDDRVVKMDELSEAEISKKGKKQEVLLTEGELFFNVEKPLDKEESLTIRTATTFTGIRGTAGFCKVIDEFTTEIYLLSGHVEIKTESNFKTGEIKREELWAGEKAVCSILNPNTEQQIVSVAIKAFTENEVDGFVAVEIAGNENLQERITSEGKLNVPLIVEGAQEKLLEEQRQNEAAGAQSGAAAGSAGSGEVIPVFKDEADAGKQHNGGSGSSSGSGGSGGSGGSDGSDDSDSSESEEPVVPPRPEISADITTVNQDEIFEMLETTDVALNGWGYLKIDNNITVPASAKLTLGSGIVCQVMDGSQLTVNGHLDMEGRVDCAGTIKNAGKITSSGITCENSSTFYNEGEISAHTISVNAHSTFEMHKGKIQGRIVCNDDSNLILTGGTVLGVSNGDTLGFARDVRPIIDFNGEEPLHIRSDKMERLINRGPGSFADMISCKQVGDLYELTGIAKGENEVLEMIENISADELLSVQQDIRFSTSEVTWKGGSESNRVNIFMQGYKLTGLSTLTIENDSFFEIYECQDQKTGICVKGDLILNDCRYQVTSGNPVKVEEGASLLMDVGKIEAETGEALVSAGKVILRDTTISGKDEVTVRVESGGSIQIAGGTKIINSSTYTNGCALGGSQGDGTYEFKGGLIQSVNGKALSDPGMLPDDPADLHTQIVTKTVFELPSQYAFEDWPEDTSYKKIVENSTGVNLASEPPAVRTEQEQDAATEADIEGETQEETEPETEPEATSEADNAVPEETQPETEPVTEAG